MLSWTAYASDAKPARAWPAAAQTGNAKSAPHLELDAEVLVVHGGREAVGQQQNRAGGLRARAHQVALAQRTALIQRQPPVVQLLRVRVATINPKPYTGGVCARAHQVAAKQCA